MTIKKASVQLKASICLLLISSCLILSSCLKDKFPGNQNYSHSPALISFQYAGFSATPFVASVLPQPNDSFKIELTLSVASLTLKSPVTATVSVDAASLQTFNADTTRGSYPTVFSQLPTDQFTILNGGSVTIAPGQQKVMLTVLFSGDKIDFTQDYALPLKITSAQGATIATNLNTAILLLKLRSIYEGSYTETGNRTGYNGGDNTTGVAYVIPLSGTATLSTNTANSVFAPAADLGTTILLEVDPTTNQVTISDPGNSFSPLGNDSSISTYDPATHTFDLHWFYKNGSGKYRHIDQTFVLQ